jgi:hypothetical protein
MQMVFGDRTNRAGLWAFLTNLLDEADLRTDGIVTLA